MAASGNQLTYADFDGYSQRLAAHFRSLGLTAGAHVAYATGNHEYTLSAYWAAQRTGLFWTPLNTRWTAGEMAYVLNDSKSQAVIVNRDTEGTVTKALAEVDHDVAVLSLDEGTGVDSVASLPSVLADTEPIDAGAELEGVDMLYSSGTTGRPKGVIPDSPGRPFGIPSRVTDDLRAFYGIDESTVYLVATPLYHVAALATAMMTQRSGGIVVVMDRFDPQGFLRCVQDFGVTHSIVVPTILSRLLEHRDSTGDSYDVSSLRFLGHGAAPCPPTIKERALEWFGPTVYDCWGATERPGLSFLRPEEWKERPTSVGRPLSGTPHILDKQMRELGPGQVGEIFWETDTPFEYHNHPEKTRESRSPQGWCSVGDLGYLDEEGYMYLTDRAAFMIITGGENVYPVEIENALIAHPDIRDAAVVGHEDPDLGQRVVAFVEPIRPVENEVAWVESVNRYLREHLAGYKCPREIRLVDQLPRTPTGKVMKRDLL